MGEEEEPTVVVLGMASKAWSERSSVSGAEGTAVTVESSSSLPTPAWRLASLTCTGRRGSGAVCVAAEAALWAGTSARAVCVCAVVVVCASVPAATAACACCCALGCCVGAALPIVCVAIVARETAGVQVPVSRVSYRQPSIAVG